MKRRPSTSPPVSDGDSQTVPDWVSRFDLAAWVDETEQPSDYEMWVFEMNSRHNHYQTLEGKVATWRHVRARRRHGDAVRAWREEHSNGELSP
jgi:hypothetical protein